MYHYSQYGPISDPAEIIPTMRNFYKQYNFQESNYSNGSTTELLLRSTSTPAGYSLPLVVHFKLYESTGNYSLRLHVYRQDEIGDFMSPTSPPAGDATKDLNDGDDYSSGYQYLFLGSVSNVTLHLFSDSTLLGVVASGSGAAFAYLTSSGISSDDYPVVYFCDDTYTVLSGSSGTGYSIRIGGVTYKNDDAYRRLVVVHGANNPLEQDSNFESMDSSYTKVIYPLQFLCSYNGFREIRQANYLYVGHKSLVELDTLTIGSEQYKVLASSSAGSLVLKLPSS